MVEETSMAAAIKEEVMVEVVISTAETMIIKEGAMGADSNNRTAVASNNMGVVTRADMEEEIKEDMEEDSNNTEAGIREGAMITNKGADTAGASNTMVVRDSTVGATSHKAAIMVAVEALAEVMI